MPKAILFDLDGTLLDRDSTVQELLTAQYDRFRPVLSQINPEAYVQRVLELDAHGHRDKVSVYQLAAAEFGLPSELAPELTADFWSSYHAFCRAYPEVNSVLLELRSRGLKLGVITNGSVQIQEAVVQRLGVSDLLDTVLISEREGTRKPSPEIFERAVHRLGVRSEEAWFVGDHPNVDVEGATAAGLTAVWRRNENWPEPRSQCHRVSGINELLPLLVSEE